MKNNFKIKICMLSFLSQFLLCSYTSTPQITLEWHAFTKATKRSDGTDAGGLGHSFIKVVNDSSKSIEIGYYTLPANSYVTIGLWTSGAVGSSSSNSSFAPAIVMQKVSNFKQGVLYNEERLKYTIQEKMEDDIYAKMTLNDSALEKLNQVLVDKNSSYNVITYNCATFTTEIWNKLNDTTYWTGWFRKPSNNKDDISNYTHYDGNDSLTYTNAVYYYDQTEGELLRV